MLNAVGVDVSKGKSTISVLQPGGVVVRKPFDVTHSKDDLKELARYVDRKNYNKSSRCISRRASS